MRSGVRSADRRRTLPTRTNLRTHLAGALLGGVLVLPQPATTSRERDFCRAWLALPTAGRQAVLETAERSEAGGAWDAQCRAGVRSGLRHRLDAECASWRQLMDFEVRKVVDRVLRPCLAADSGRLHEVHD